MQRLATRQMTLEEWQDVFWDEEAMEELLPWEEKSDKKFAVDIVDKVLQYHGIIGYTGMIIRLIERAYDVDINDEFMAF